MKSIVLLTLVMILSSCSYLKERYAKEPEIDLAKIYLQDTTPFSTTMVFVLSVKNPNKIDLNVDELSYEVQLDDKEFAKAKSDKKTKIPAGETTLVEVPLPVSFLKAIDGVAKVLSGQDVGYQVIGDVKVSGFRIPFKEKGQFNMNGLKKNAK